MRLQGSIMTAFYKPKTTFKTMRITLPVRIESLPTIASEYETPRRLDYSLVLSGSFIKHTFQQMAFETESNFNRESLGTPTSLDGQKKRLRNNVYYSKRRLKQTFARNGLETNLAGAGYS